MVAPATFSPGADKRAKYHNAGVLSFRCGSFASNGLPVVVRLPATTQLLEPTPSTPDGGAMSGSTCQAVARSPASSFRLRNSAA